jgi:hypothetical protein
VFEPGKLAETREDDVAGRHSRLIGVDDSDVIDDSKGQGPIYWPKDAGAVRMMGTP